MIKGAIFDLDQTLVDTSSVEMYRDKRMWSIVYEKLNLTSVCPNVREILNLLEKHNIKMCIVTSSKKEYANKVILHHKLNIKDVVAYSDTRRHKPYSEPMEKALSILGLSALECINIGDQESDIQSGKSLGIFSVMVGGNSSLADINVDNTKELYYKLLEILTLN